MFRYGYKKMTMVVPARWAIDGFDAMTWRGQGTDAAGMAKAVQLGLRCCSVCWPCGSLNASKGPISKNAMESPLPHG